MDYRSGIEEEFSPARDKLYCWRGLRLFAAENLQAFFAISQGTTFASAVVSTLGIKLPSRPIAEVSPAHDPEGAEGGGGSAVIASPHDVGAEEPPDAA
jgi:hypothetical protein